MLLNGGVALWDAIEGCDIKGSSDASIRNVVPAHIERITDAAPIEVVVCNGGTAGRLYKRYSARADGVARRRPALDKSCQRRLAIGAACRALAAKPLTGQLI